MQRAWRAGIPLGAILALVISLIAARRGRPQPPLDPTSSSAAPSALPSVGADAGHRRASSERDGPRRRAGGMDVAFLVTADTHLGYGEPIRLPTGAMGGIED